MACITKEMEAVIERFEAAVRHKEAHAEYAGVDDDDTSVETEYEAAKAELTECLSWVP